MYLKNGAAAAGNTALKWYQKPVKWLGNLISYGRIRETIKPLKNNKFATSLAKIPYGLKVGAGYAGRIALLMAVVLPIFSGTAKKLSYAIFGKPVKTLEKERMKVKNHSRFKNSRNSLIQTRHNLLLNLKNQNRN